MSENSRTEEFLQKLAPCIERDDLDACVGEAARVAREMGVGAQELLDLSSSAGSNGIYVYAYVLALAAAHGLEDTSKASAYNNAGSAAGFLGNKEKQEEQYKQAIAANPNLAEAHTNYAILLYEINRKKKAEATYKKTI